MWWLVGQLGYISDYEAELLWSRITMVLCGEVVVPMQWMGLMGWACGNI